MDYNKGNIRELLSKYADNRLTSEELKMLQDYVNSLSDEELYEDMYAEWENKLTGHEEKSIAKPQRRKYIIGAWSAVAASVILFVLSFWLVEHTGGKGDMERIAAVMEEGLGSTKDIRLILDSEKTVKIERGAVVEYQKDGTVYVDKNEVDKASDREVNTDRYNRLFVPKGKYTHVILSDGTTMYVNAGTKVVYPGSFSEERREIFVDGEVFLNVTPNKQAPFIVKTVDFEVQVLGTVFNVHAYSADKDREVVLSEGKVNVLNRKGDKQTLLPNEKMVIADDGSMAKSVVDAKEYMLWTKGILSLKNDPLHVVLMRLGRYYGVDIQCSDDIASVNISGKIDLECMIDEVLKRLAIIGGFSCTKQGEMYVLQSAATQ